MASPVGFQALTLKSQGRLARLITDVTVSAAFDEANPPDPLPTGIQAKALWDTGATRSVVSVDLIRALGVTSVGIANVDHGGGAGTSPTYLLNFKLQHGVVFQGVLVTEFPAPRDQSFGVIIGMDIICFGDFSITNVANKTWMSFRTPSLSAIDYVIEGNKLVFAGTGRNDPCPCGSGKKFKRCHGISS